MISTRYWVLHGAPVEKLVLGVATFSRTWKLTENSQYDGNPPIRTHGPGAPGSFTKTPGLLSYSEFCLKLKNNSTDKLKVVIYPPKSFASYAFHPYNESAKSDGIWISYEDSLTSRVKGHFVRTQGLYGVALYDISLDDFNGVCSNNRYPLLKSAKSSFSEDTVNSWFQAYTYD